MIYVSCNSNCVSTSDSFSAPQIRSTILALYKLVCMYVCMYVCSATEVFWHSGALQIGLLTNLNSPRIVFAMKILMSTFPNQPVPISCRYWSWSLSNFCFVFAIHPTNNTKMHFSSFHTLLSTSNMLMVRSSGNGSGHIKKGALRWTQSVLRSVTIHHLGM